jgi:hypothetical protein
MRAERGLFAGLGHDDQRDVAGKPRCATSVVDLKRSDHCFLRESTEVHGEA